MGITWTGGTVRKSWTGLTEMKRWFIWHWQNSMRKNGQRA